MQALKPPPSSWQAKVEPGSLARKVKVAVGLLSRSGGLESIDVSGAVVSTLKVVGLLVPVLLAVSRCSAWAV